jgi:hypothetical protein
MYMAFLWFLPSSSVLLYHVYTMHAVFFCAFLLSVAVLNAFISSVLLLPSFQPGYILCTSWYYMPLRTIVGCTVDCTMSAWVGWILPLYGILFFK